MSQLNGVTTQLGRKNSGDFTDRSHGQGGRPLKGGEVVFCACATVARPLSPPSFSSREVEKGGEARFAGAREKAWLRGWPSSRASACRCRLYKIIMSKAEADPGGGNSECSSIPPPPHASKSYLRKSRLYAKTGAGSRHSCHIVSVTPFSPGRLFFVGGTDTKFDGSTK